MGNANTVIISLQTPTQMRILNTQDHVSFQRGLPRKLLPTLWRERMGNKLNQAFKKNPADGKINQNI